MSATNKTKEVKRLFEVIIVLNPTAAEEEQNVDPKIILENKLFAKNSQKAGFAAIMMLAKEYSDKIEQIEVLVRPF